MVVAECIILRYWPGNDMFPVGDQREFNHPEKPLPRCVTDHVTSQLNKCHLIHLVTSTAMYNQLIRQLKRFNLVCAKGRE